MVERIERVAQHVTRACWFGCLLGRFFAFGLKRQAGHGSAWLLVLTPFLVGFEASLHFCSSFAFGIPGTDSPGTFLSGLLRILAISYLWRSKMGYQNGSVLSMVNLHGESLSALHAV